MTFNSVTAPKPADEIYIWQLQGTGQLRRQRLFAQLVLNSDWPNRFIRQSANILRNPITPGQKFDTLKFLVILFVQKYDPTGNSHQTHFDINKVFFKNISFQNIFRIYTLVCHIFLILFAICHKNYSALETVFSMENYQNTLT